MKVFITGATGFLGKAVAEDLLEHGIAVRAMVRRPTNKLPKGAEAVEVGFEDQAALEKAIKGTDAVIHLAGKVSRDPKDASAMHWIHVEATRTLLAAMEAVEVEKLVLASTSGTVSVGENKDRVYTEEDSPDFAIIGRWPYYVSKLYQEQEVLRWNADGRVQASILNPSLLLGPGDDRFSSTEDVLRVLQGRVPATTSGTVAFVDVRDVAPMFRVALGKARAGHRYLLNGANMSVRTFFERIGRAGDVNPPSLRLPNRWALTSAKVLDGLYRAVDRTPPVDPVSVDMGRYHWACSSDKATAELGFTTREPQLTIQDTVRYLEDRGLFRRPR